MAEYHLKAPLIDEDVTKLKIGDMVYLSGECFTCRSRLQKYIFDEKMFCRLKQKIEIF